MFDDKAVLFTGGTGLFNHNNTATLLARNNTKEFIISSFVELKQYGMQPRFHSLNESYITIEKVDTKLLCPLMQSVGCVTHFDTQQQVSNL